MSPVQEVFDAIADGIASEPGTVSKVGGVFHFKISDKSYTVDLKNGKGSVKSSAPEKADCTLTFGSETDFVNLMTGKANGQNLFMQGKMKIQGNMGLAMKLDKIPKKPAAGGSAPAAGGSAPAAGGSAPAAGGSAPAAGSSAFRSAAVFEDLKKRVAATPDLVQQVNGVYQFDISKDGKTESWTVDLKNGKGSVAAGKAPKADCTLAVVDDDFVGMMTGKINSQQLFTQGKLKIKGNMGLAMKLTKLQQAKAAL